ncbi:MAG: UvrD-helicase domain-containing protein, partial [Clostridia bacterium]|nr:UvrD-helicase domain-containing protein [Clostridia bacterium]
MQDLRTRYLEAKRRLFDKVYGERLNPMQRRAVFTANGPLLVLAGAGSGKTTVLVNRIAYLIKYGNAYFDTEVPEGLTEATVRAFEGAYELTARDIEEILPEFISKPAAPWRVLAITFTNKAAREIKDRLSMAFDDKSVPEAIWSGTFHSVCLRILHKFGTRLGYRDGFSIYDTDDQKKLISECMKKLDISDKVLPARSIAAAISTAKDRLIYPADFEVTHDPRSRDIKNVYALYQNKLMENNAVDFDDIIMRTVELLENDTEVRSYYQHKFDYVLVDEYQDTNHAQFRLTSLLADGHRNIMVVGDDDQSIYKFRGATVENILDFDKTYPGATVVKLEENYRSTETILEAANAVIANNSHRHAKHLWSKKGKGDKITLHEAPDGISEGKYIIDKIISGVRNEGHRYSDYAVLFRINELARTLESTFTRSGIPYRVLAGTRFYDRKEIKDMVAYLTAINNSTDNLRLKRIINEPKRKIGAATVEAIEEIAAIEGITMLDVIRRADRYTALSKSSERLLGFAALIDRIASEESLPSKMIERVFNESGYRDMLLTEEEQVQAQTKIDHVNEFIQSAIDYEKKLSDSEGEPTLEGFLEEVLLVSEVDKYDEDADAVVLMTMHSAKGLEFPYVFLAGMEEGIFPSSKSGYDEDELQEERRLAYVAITRAKHRLYITYTKNRIMYGRTTYNMLSRFVREEIPEPLIAESARRKAPPTSTYSGIRGERGRTERSSDGGYYAREINRARQTPQIKRTDASGYGIEKLPAGTRVKHALFGTGVIKSLKDMGGDVL